MSGRNTRDPSASVSLGAGQQVFIRVTHFGDNLFRMGNGVFVIHAAFTLCGSADFNRDGDIGTDADIESFFRCIAGACPPPPCTSTADFNGDGDIGADADIEAFFRVLAGGSCRRTSFVACRSFAPGTARNERRIARPGNCARTCARLQ